MAMVLSIQSPQGTNNNSSQGEVSEIDFSATLDLATSSVVPQLRNSRCLVLLKKRQSLRNHTLSKKLNLRLNILQPSLVVEYWVEFECHI